MNIIHWIGLLSTVGCKLGRTPFVYRFDLRLMREQMGMSFLKDVPEFSHDHIELTNGRALAGYIVKRPLNVLGGTTVEYHYGVVLGTGVNGDELILEMTKGKNVNIVRKQDFIGGFAQSDLQVHTDKEVDRENILSRAKKFQYHTYNLLDLNCKDFVYYCAFLIDPPSRSLDVARFQLELNDLALQYWAIQLEFGSDTIKKQAAREIKQLELIKAELQLALNPAK